MPDLCYQADQPRLHHNPLNGRFTPKLRTFVVQPSDPHVRHIGLTLGQIAVTSALLYDDLSQYEWFAWWSKKTRSFYAKRSEYIDGKLVIILMHRHIVGLHPSDKRQVDHQNGNTLDYRGENLRIATKSQNMQNRGKPRNNTSGYKGVTFYKPTQKWKAQIGYLGYRINIGYYLTAEAAARAYDAVAAKLFGEFAVLNFPNAA